MNQNAQHQDPETEANWKLAIISFIINTCVFPTETSKNVGCEQGTLHQLYFTTPTFLFLNVLCSCQSDNLSLGVAVDCLCH